VSVKAVSWAIDTRVGDPTLKVLLIAIANYANHEHECWYPQGILARDAEISDRTVRRSLVKLRAAGLIQTSQRKRADGSNGTLVIRLMIQGADKLSGPAERADNLSGGCGHSYDRADRTQLCPEGADTKMSGPNEPSVEPSIEPSKTPVASKATKRTDADIDQIFEDRFWLAYPKRLGSRGKPEAKKKFRTIVKAGADVEKIVAEATKLAADWARRIARKPADATFIPMAATWLNKGRWDDEPDDVNGDGGPPMRGGGGDTIFDIANDFERRVRTNEATHGNSTGTDDNGHRPLDLDL
jgi:hypothetical protein